MGKIISITDKKNSPEDKGIGGSLMNCTKEATALERELPSHYSEKRTKAQFRKETLGKNKGKVKFGDTVKISPERDAENRAIIEATFNHK